MPAGDGIEAVGSATGNEVDIVLVGDVKSGLWNETAKGGLGVIRW
jgi:hypothetical protein